MNNKPAILNAVTLAFLYIYIILIRLGWLGKDFDILFIPILALGLISELWFIAKSLVKK